MVHYSGQNLNLNLNFWILFSVFELESQFLDLILVFLISGSYFGVFGILISWNVKKDAVILFTGHLVYLYGRLVISGVQSLPKMIVDWFSWRPQTYQSSHTAYVQLYIF